MSTPALERSLRPVHLAAIGMGMTIGVGWIVLTGKWIADAGPGGAAFAFAIGGLFMLLVAFCYADMATRLPSVSGEYGYVSAVFGRGWGFAVGWLVLLGYVGICCFEGLALAWLLSVLASGMAGPILYTVLGAPVRALDLVVVVGGTLFFSALNFLGARESAAVQVTVTAGKVLLSFAFIAIGLIGGKAANWSPAFEPRDSGGIAAVLVMVPALFCGFNALAQALDEAQIRPSHSQLSRLVAAVIIVTTIFYVCVIISTAAAAPRAVLQNSEVPVVAAIRAVAGPAGGQIVLIAGVVALLSAWNAAMFAASRLIHTLSCGGTLPVFLSRVHPKYGTPGAAVLFVGVVALAAGLMGHSFIAPLVRLGALGFSVGFVATCLSSLGLRRMSGPPGVLPSLAALIGAVALSAVILLSVYRMFLSPASLRAEAIALSGWIAAGALLWIGAAQGRRLSPVNGSSG